MSKTVFFLNMFPDYQPSEDLYEALSQAAITAADIDPESRSVTVTITSETYIPQKLLMKAAPAPFAVCGKSWRRMRSI